jgi:hypothetical protein
LLSAEQKGPVILEEEAKATASSIRARATQKKKRERQQLALWEGKLVAYLSTSKKHSRMAVRSGQVMTYLPAKEDALQAQRSGLVKTARTAGIVVTAPMSKSVTPTAFR